MTFSSSCVAPASCDLSCASADTACVARAVASFRMRLRNDNFPLFPLSHETYSFVASSFSTLSTSFFCFSASFVASATLFSAAVLPDSADSSCNQPFSH